MTPAGRTRYRKVSVEIWNDGKFAKRSLTTILRQPRLQIREQSQLQILLSSALRAGV